jgi:hypothetical protein
MHVHFFLWLTHYTCKISVHTAVRKVERYCWICWFLSPNQFNTNMKKLVWRFVVYLLLVIFCMHMLHWGKGEQYYCITLVDPLMLHAVFIYSLKPNNKMEQHQELLMCDHLLCTSCKLMHVCTIITVRTDMCEFVVTSHKLLHAIVKRWYKQ